MVENFASSQLGGLGSQLLGKESVAGNIERRFTKASGGQLLDRVYDDSTKVQSIESQARKLIEAGKTQEALSLIKQNKDLLSKTKVIKSARSEVDKLQKIKKQVKEDTRLTPEQQEKVLVLIQQKLNALSVGYGKLQNQ